jgi:hypothetical protein
LYCLFTKQVNNFSKIVEEIPQNGYGTIIGRN